MSENIEIVKSLVQNSSDKTTFDFEYKTCHGQLAFVNSNIELLLVFNNEKGNGVFKELIEKFENKATEYGLGFRVINFLNDNLKEWFVKRGYKIIDEDFNEQIAVYE